MKRLVALAAVVVLAASVAPTALAQGKGKGKGNASSVPAFSLSMVADYNPNGRPNWGEQIAFQIAPMTETSDPRVQVMCFQNGELVYGGLWQPLVSVLTLSSRAWQSGAAECTATLYYIADNNKIVHLESMQFSVEE